MPFAPIHSSILFLLILSMAQHSTSLSVDWERDHCSIKGQTLTCHRSEHPLQIIQNLAQAEGDGVNLTEIVITESGLTHFPPQVLTCCPFLVSLDLSGNEINDFGSVLGSHPSLQSLNFSRNGELHIDLESVFKNLPSLRLIDLSFNHIMSVGKNNQYVDDRQTVILLTESNVTCDNDSSWLTEFISSEVQRTSPRVVVDDARCMDGRLDGVSLSNGYSCLSALSHPTCRLCECVFKPSLQVNCSSKGLTDFPVSLPAHTKVVDLNHNMIRKIRLTPDWGSVIYLHLENNRIESLKGLEGNAFASNIRFLSLQSNRLTEIQAHVLKQVNVDRISLSDNPWTCDCDAIAFQLWIQDHSTQILDMEDIRCAGPATTGQENGVNADVSSDVDSMLSGRTTYRILRSDLCPQPVVGATYKFYDMASMTMAVLTVVILCKLAYDWWWQRRTGKLPRFFKVNI